MCVDTHVGVLMPTRRMAHTVRPTGLPMGWVDPSGASVVVMSCTHPRAVPTGLTQLGCMVGALLSVSLLWRMPGASAQQRVAAEEDPAPVAPSAVAAEPLLEPSEPEPTVAKKRAASRAERGAAKSGRGGQSRKAKRVRVGRQPSAEYQRLRDGWHAPVETVPVPDVTGRIPLVLSRVNGGEPVTLVPSRDDGGFSDEDLQRASRAFCPPEAKRVHAIAPRLLDLVYRTMLHFQAPLVHVVSGYRPDRAGSRHTQGRAIDMVIPGVTNEQLAEHVRTLGFVGVGIYPKSGFVHLDVRDRSFFWVDMSLPGERSRMSAHLGTQAQENDVAARARGEAPDVYVPNNEREDRAAARSYARRAKLRRLRAQRQLDARAARDAADEGRSQARATTQSSDAPL